MVPDGGQARQSQAKLGVHIPSCQELGLGCEGSTVCVWIDKLTSMYVQTSSSDLILSNLVGLGDVDARGLVFVFRL